MDVTRGRPTGVARVARRGDPGLSLIGGQFRVARVRDPGYDRGPPPGNISALATPSTAPQ